MRKQRRNIAASAFTAIGLGSGLFAPGVAHAGFFEQLFGLEPAPSTGYDRTERPYEPQPYRRAVRPKKAAAVDTKPKRQMPTDLMHDATLRPGDAVMMKGGMRVYEGDDQSKHDKRDFVALEAAPDVPKKPRAELVALDTTRNDPLRGTVTPNVIASGRSAAVGAPISQGYRITDARGKSMRYVGP